MKKRTARFWHDELAAEAQKNDHQAGGREWRERAKKVVERYRDERKRGSGKRFNIFWSNVETLKATIYSQSPNPDVRRRFRDKDVVGRIGAEVLERALSFTLDDYDSDEVFEAARDDGLIPGRGQVWVEYEPYLGKVRPAEDEETPEGEGSEYDREDDEGPYKDEKVDERTYCIHLQWDCFRHTPCAEWRDVWWVARKHLMDKDELEDSFGDIAKKLPLDIKEKGEENRGKASIWEIWDKKTRKVYWVHDVWKEDILKEAEDPLNLVGFFPCPEPYVPIRTTDDWTPIPEYTLYQDQAEEIDMLSHRIQKMVGAFRPRGAYDGSIKGLENVLTGEDLKLVPVEDAERWVDKGGLEKGVMWLPLDMLAQSIAALYEAREKSKQELYEITGISDIIRGATKASETATAQQLKGNFGNLRMQPRQKPFARFVRDILRIKAEIIAEHYSAETLARMTGLQLPTPEEKAQLQMQLQQQQMMQQMQQQGMGPPNGAPPGPQPQGLVQ